MNVMIENEIPLLIKPSKSVTALHKNKWSQKPRDIYRSGGISQELSETILAMATNCSLLMNKPRHGPPGVLRSHRTMEPAFTPFPAQPVDPLANIGSSLANMAIGGPPSSSAFSLQGGLGPLGQ